MLVTNDTPEFEGVEPFTSEYAVLFKQWCKKVNAYYYSKPKETFNKFEALYLAEKAKADILILENLS